jgi:hypothetical protein
MRRMAFQLPKFKLLGRDDDLLLILVGLGAIAFIATAVNAEMERRWKQAAAGAAGAVGMLTGLPTGRKKAHDRGFDEGYWQPNPAITIDDRLQARDAARLARGGGSAVAGMVGGAVMTGVAAGVSGVVANTVADRFSPRGPSTETLAPAPPQLPLRPLLEAMTVSQLRSYAREQGRGGDGLSSAKKAEIIDRLLAD